MKLIIKMNIIIGIRVGLADSNDSKISEYIQKGNKLRLKPAELSLLKELYAESSQINSKCEEFSKLIADIKFTLSVDAENNLITISL